MSDDTVRVAVRIRPLVPTEVERGCQTCIAVVPGEQQIRIGNGDKSFTFNHVFGPEVDHDHFYTTAIRKMVNKIFKGYNVTILAYGQTGSGKTHSMGTNYTGDEPMGVIPRAVHEIFEIMESKKDHTYKVAVSFMELYQEQLYDLLSEKQRTERIVDIREDVKGVKIVGITEQEVTTASEALEALTRGSQERATGATAMNSQSSRSHAIFTVVIHQLKNDDPNSATTSKFHLVDLAGSERSKKTQATGERFKEGVNINKGLLALGNVISQLGEGGSASYIGYRDSKLTRLLQDSLGGNSMTLMIACVSPADYNLDETLSTLRYADRARKIKNKPIVNQDPKAAEINRLNGLVQELRLALLGQGTSGLSCPPEHEDLQEKNRGLQKKLRELTEQLNGNLIEIVHMHERAELAEQARESIKLSMSKILEEFDQVLKTLDDKSVERGMFEPIYMKILDLQNDQKKTAEEILQHELTAMSSVNKSIGDDDVARESVDEIMNDDTDVVRCNLDEKHAEHTLRQAERNHEVQSINRALAIKEELVSTLLRNSSQFAEHSKDLQIMETEIKTLQSEKEELLQTLQNVQTNSVSAKLAQTRRKKVQELEKKISELTRKCTEQTRIIKKKEKSDQQIKNLSTEIQSLKQTRVKLIREMRKESEAFSKWKRASEREMYRLKDQDRKRQNEMVRLQTQHNKQQNVFKRKMEEACAINKRLKDALELQRKAQHRRDKHLTNKEGGMRDWVQQEIAVLVSTIDAECSLEKLMQDRADLTKELETLKAANANNPQSLHQLTELQEYLDLRNAQIADLQREIVESDQDNRANTRLNMIHSMTDAKAAVKVLFEIAAADHKKHCTSVQEHDELMEKYDAALMKLRQYELRQNPDALDSLQRVKELEEELESYKDKCERLEEQVSITESSEPVKQRKKAKVAPRMRLLAEPTYNSSFHITDDSFSEEDDDKDPDWKKTPLYNRMRKVLAGKNISNELSTTTNNKRSSDGEIKCSCKGNCSTRLCTCRKNGMSCTNCNCVVEICQNRDKENTCRDLFTDFTSTQEIDQNESTKRPRLDM